jgi:hypothetical protein
MFMKILRNTLNSSINIGLNLYKICDVLSLRKIEESVPSPQNHLYTLP